MILMQTDLHISLLEQLIDILQSCFSVEEACTAIKPLIQQLFPNEAGAIYVLSSSKNLLKAIATWGPVPLTSDPIFTPHECLALRRGQAHLVEDTHHGLLCQHIRPDSVPVETFCVPMMAHGETVGVLSISSLHRGEITTIKQLALKVAKYIGLALANLKLRESINNQSLRDPLTKLYNRRYLEESLEREIRRSERHLQPLGIIMLDIDHFMHLNETFGYEASDFLLREIGMFLQNKIRRSDIACRYRHEGFLLMLPETPLEVTQQRAEQLRQQIKQLNIQYRRQTFDSITISCGVASFPESALTGKEVIQAADVALNCAKEQGSDRVVTASSIVEES
ncbi:MAG TPA: sensor domain-containing diguanylate cyclase [Coleofasciculaceae cyanobacterium]|jgi:diguanylate cyclase (GGDEF)-like protein